MKKVSFVAFICFILMLLASCNKKPTMVTVTFDSNGGSSVLAQVIKKGDKAIRPEDPIYEGYDFDNWFYQNEVWDFTKAVNNNMTLKANWTPKNDDPILDIFHTVSFYDLNKELIYAFQVNDGECIGNPEGLNNFLALNANYSEYVKYEWRYEGEKWIDTNTVTSDLDLYFYVEYDLSINDDLIYENSSSYLKDSSNNYYWGYESDFDFASYYKAIDGITSEDLLRSNLHNILTSNITRLSYSEVWNGLKSADEDLNDSNSILCILTGKTMPKANQDTGGGGTDYWNREHIWAKSYGFKTNEGYYAYTDLNHLRASEAYTNSTYHNNRFYDYVLEPANTDIYGNKYDSFAYEVRDEAKGDIARMIFYMDIRYEGDAIFDNGLNLSITNSRAEISLENGIYGILDTLLEWNEIDPVDDYERLRNDRVFSIQGNRNPFIDIPNLVDYIYGYTSTTNQSGNRVYYFVENGSFQYVDNNYYKTCSLIVEPDLIPISNSLKYEFEGWYTDYSCTTKFDFSKNVMGEKDLFLFALFTEKSLNIGEEFGLLDTNASLEITYDKKPSDDLNTIYETMVITPTADGGSRSGIKTDSIYTYDEYLNYDKSMFKIEFYSHAKANMYVGQNKIRLYNGLGNGTELHIKGLDDENIIICDVKFDYTINSPKDYSGDCILVIASDGSNASIQNCLVNADGKTSGNMIDITKITVTYYVISEYYSYEINDVNINVGGYYSKDLFDLYENNKCKLEVVINGDTYDITDISYDEEKEQCYFYYALNINDYDLEYLAYAKLTYNGNTYKMGSISYSAKSLAKYLLQNERKTNEYVKNNLAAFKLLAYY